MKGQLILCFILSLAWAGCKSSDANRDVNIPGEPEPLSGLVRAAEPLCAGDANCVNPTGTLVLLEFTVRGSCTEGSSFQYSVHKATKDTALSITVYAKDYPDSAHETGCPLIARLKHVTLTLKDVQPPFVIYFDGTELVDEITDYDAWTNGLRLD